MKDQKSSSVWQKAIFAITTLLACLTTESNNLKGYLGSGHGTVFIMFKLILIISFVFIVTLINESNIKFISKYMPIMVNIITAMVIFDYYVTHYSGSMFLFNVWWMMSILSCEAAVFVAVTLSHNTTDDYNEFYKKFFIGFTPLYVFVLILCFARTPFTGELTVNTRLGNGTFLMLKAFLNDVNVSFEAPLIFFGNLVILSPLPLIINAISKRIKPWMITCIGLVIPYAIEGYQYLFKCGDVDIDDIVLNQLGLIIGIIIMLIINKYKLQQKRTQ